MEYNIKEHIQPLHHVGFVVTDVEKSMDFYINVLGFERYDHWFETEDMVGPGFGVEGASLELAQVVGYGCMVELFKFTTSAGDDSKFSTNKVGTGHLSFLVDDLPAVVEHLKSKGVEFVSDPIVLPSSTWVMFYDPDGIRIEIMQFFKNNGFEPENKIKD